MERYKNTARNLLKRNELFIKYILIGFTGLALDLASFVFMVRVLKMNELVANPISMTVGIVNNFFWNAYLNFKKTDNLLRRFASFYTIGLFGIFIGNTFLWFFNGVVGEYVSRLLNIILPLLSHYRLEIVKSVSIVVVAIVQYFLNKRFSFKA